MSWRDSTYSSGNIAIEAIPGAAYGFANFGGGTPAMPVQTAITTTSVDASGAGVTPGQQVTYTATVSPAPDGGTISFADNAVAIPNCGAQTVNDSGKATCKVTYTALGTHVVTARYTGSSDGEFAGSTNGPDAIVRVISPSSAKLVATNTSLSLSSATPATRTAVRYTASVSPDPDGGTVLVHRRQRGHPRLHLSTGHERDLDLQGHVWDFRDPPDPRRLQWRFSLRGF